LISKPKTVLALPQIVDTAVQILDENGLDGFTMRSLGKQLGRSAMAAYRHVSDRDSLLRLAAQAVQEELPNVDDLPWYERLEVIARHGWRTSWRPHPWVVDLIGGEPTTSLEKARLALMEQTFRDAGFEEDDIVRALVAHWSFVIGTLQFVKRLASQSPDIDPDDVFEFNLRAWILGLGAKATHAHPSNFARVGATLLADTRGVDVAPAHTKPNPIT